MENVRWMRELTLSPMLARNAFVMHNKCLVAIKSAFPHPYTPGVILSLAQDLKRDGKCKTDEGINHN
ncbi:hypothetical protein CA265_01150 [Sphingobacteriaceae bacterium GW460-11-11-14-LB5]|nr:hypothetical protein CA265_01150 [Sphingobacteriaceae bacterium GW460-11-11-14-LB5]